MTDRLDLLPRHRAKLEEIIVRHLPEVEVWAYGSRVNEQSDDSSDLDLVVRGPGLKEFQFDVMKNFKVAIRESRIPILVEARAWTRIRFPRLGRPFSLLG
ncbi:nucleotidyltransferase domain-containing protein [Candidatus Poribacteria bacterium]|nr:nucleotidyltransferase domain-containing protein [Candidatus Poribacteria bacterium]